MVLSVQKKDYKSVIDFNSASLINSEEPTEIQIDALGHWLKAVSFHEILTKEDEVQLGKKIAVGDQEAVDTLVQSNLRLAVSVAFKYQGNNIPLEDLIKKGILV